MNTIRFDAETGTLEGTNFPTIPALIEYMKANGFRGRQFTSWNQQSRCGCPVIFYGFIQGMLDPARSFGFGLVTVMEAIPDQDVIVSGIVRGFDGYTEEHCEEGGIDGWRYGVAAHKAMRDADLLSY